ncbi:glycerophosphodiester phosphodiesterase family protein [Meridianimarinicoccus sp. RP-17]|uniref:glycerophosphodiester phosphodiesterase family protein n=1 Tax=Meridianimarinicoccus zhengii TaxID=2056810 RepID=UPI000DAB52B2|nr:glycerophosphodiester phosphodiesterase family protein [Phycocomes zhengii]
MRKHHALYALAFAILATGPMAADAAVFDGFRTLNGKAPVVVAHRGAPAYLPENSIGGNELSAEMGAELIETDVMMTRDGVLIAMHDTTLTRTTNVAEVYAPRNGNYRVSDFDYDELQSLTLKPTGSGQLTYPGFEPSDPDAYRIPTFADMLDALNDYNSANGTNVGILTEAKYGFNADTNRAVIATLADKGFTTSDKSVVQGFDFGNVFDFLLLQDEFDVDMGVAQLGSATMIGDEWGVSNLVSLTNLSKYVDTVAVNTGSLTEEFIAAAHDLDLSVFAWTYRPADLDAAFAQMSDHIAWGLDGLITDNPDLARAVIDSIAAAGTVSAINTSVAPVPVPAALPLLAGAFGALAMLRRSKAARG